MTSATFHHTASQARQTAASAAPAQAITETAAPEQGTAAERYQAADAKVTARLALITGVATLVILVFFLAMMWILAGYGPSAA